MQNRPRSDRDGLAMVWLHSSGLKASRCAGIIRPGFWQDATGPLLVSHFHSVVFFHGRPGYYAKPAQSWFSSGWLCQAWAKRIWSGSKAMCKNNPARFWSVLPNRPGPDVNQIQRVYWARAYYTRADLQLSNWDTQVRFVEAIGNVPTQRSKLLALLNHGVEEAQAIQQLLKVLETETHHRLDGRGPKIKWHHYTSYKMVAEAKIPHLK